MAIDQLDLVLQFSIRVLTLVIVTAMSLHAARRLSQPTGTYGNGLPERRLHPRPISRVPHAAPQRFRDEMPGKAA